MIGRVNARREASLSLRLYGPGARSLKVSTVIDIGYNGFLTLPTSVVTALALTPDVDRSVKLADATQRIVPCYAVEFLWNRRKRRILALCLEGDPLVGTGLLDSCHVEIDFATGGRVVIRPLS